jgi:uncharacterized protein YecE (DUF72 family)
VALFIGTSGWAYGEWKGGFYPPGLSQARFLQYYASVLGACEINATFYRLQSAETFERWRKATPERFRFAVKGHRRLTHARQIGGDTAFIDEFAASITPLGERLGCLLLQFPPHRERDEAGLSRLLERLPPLPIAVEFRNESWGGIEEWMAERGGTVCVAEAEGRAHERLPPGPIAYVRLRGERYDERSRAAWLELLQSEAESRDVYAFAKHRDVPAGDPFTGVGLAEWLVNRGTCS